MRTSPTCDRVDRPKRALENTTTNIIVIIIIIVAYFVFADDRIAPPGDSCNANRQRNDGCAVRHDKGERNIEWLRTSDDVGMPRVMCSHTRNSRSIIIWSETGWWTTTTSDDRAYADVFGRPYQLNFAPQYFREKTHTQLTYTLRPRHTFFISVYIHELSVSWFSTIWKCPCRTMRTKRAKRRMIVLLFFNFCCRSLFLVWLVVFWLLRQITRFCLQNKIRLTPFVYILF